MIKFRSLCMLLIMVLILGCFPATIWGEAAQTGKPIKIEMQLNESAIIINDQKLTVEKPYLSNGSTLVPLRIITTAFGAVLSWDSATQTVGLTYGKTVIKLVIDSSNAIVDGKTEELPTAPELTNGTTMVPIRFISEHFGAVVNFDDATSKITITGSQQTDSAGSAIDSDLGKTHIGNSYYGWSMKYPTGLVRNYQSFKEDYVSFTDANGEFGLSVSIEDDQPENMSKDALLVELSNVLDSETVLEKNYKMESSRTYAYIIAKEGSAIYMYRAYQHADRVFIVSMTIKKEENYKNPSKNNGYKDLMDSFQTSFDSNDKTVKDLSTVRDGMREYTDSHFGLRVKLPADWTKTNDSNESLKFRDPKKEKFISIDMSSLKDGDTIQAWTSKARASFEQFFAAGYFKTEPLRDITVGGIAGKAMRSANSLDTKKWDATENIFLIRGKYKFSITFEFNKSADWSEAFVKQITDSIVFKDPADTVGIIKDRMDELDITKTSVVKNKVYNFSISIPDLWKKESTGTSDVQLLNYSFTGGGMTLIKGGHDAQTFLRLYEQRMKANPGNSDFKTVDNHTEKISGLNAIWIEYEYQQSSIPSMLTLCLIEKDGETYILITPRVKAVNSELNAKLIKDTLKSIVFS